MIRVRPFAPGDGLLLDRIIDNEHKHGVCLSLDRVLVAISGSEIVGVLAWRPGGMIHAFECGSSLAQPRIARALIRQARIDAASIPQIPREAVLFTPSDNRRMIRFIIEQGGVEQAAGERLFTVKL